MENVKNSVRLMGFAGYDPVVINFANQKRMARVSIAVNEFYKNSAGEAVNQTQWFNLVFWNKKAELAVKSIVKGTQFSVEGKLVTQSYTDKKGELRYTIEVNVNTLQLVDKGENKLFVEVK